MYALNIEPRFNILYINIGQLFCTIIYILGSTSDIADCLKSYLHRLLSLQQPIGSFLSILSVAGSN
jgi:hypothetical protein